jgi:hypothetical protein
MHDTVASLTRDAHIYHPVVMWLDTINRSHGGIGGETPFEPLQQKLTNGVSREICEQIKPTRTLSGTVRKGDKTPGGRNEVKVVCKGRRTNNVSPRPCAIEHRADNSHCLTLRFVFRRVLVRGHDHSPEGERFSTELFADARRTLHHQACAALDG